MTKKEITKSWKERNKERVAKTNKLWRQNNQTEIRDYRRSKYRQRKAYLVSLLGGKCIKCGYSKSFFALQFHHINPDEKEDDMARLSFEKQIEEVKKCLLLCANCHFEIHEELENT